MTRTPNTHSSTSSGTTTYGVRSRSSSRLATTNPTAPPAVLEVAGVAELGLRAAVGDVDDAEDPEGEGDPADDLASGRPVALGVAHVAPADEHEHERHQPADLADRPGDDRADALHHGAGELPPDGGRGDDGQPDDEQPDAVATLLGVEVAGASPDRAGERAQPVGDPEPHGRHAAAERGEGPEDRARPAPDGARCRPARARGRALARGALLLAGCTPGPGAGCASCGPSRRTGPTGLGRAPAPRTRRGRRTGRHDTKRRPPSLQSHGPHGRVGLEPRRPPPPWVKQGGVP